MTQKGWRVIKLQHNQSKDPEQMQQNMASDQGLYCLPYNTYSNILDTSAGIRMYYFKF